MTTDLYTRRLALEALERRMIDAKWECILSLLGGVFFLCFGSMVLIWNLNGAYGSENDIMYVVVGLMYFLGIVFPIISRISYQRYQEHKQEYLKKYNERNTIYT
jgi:hypothetical protein